MVKKSKQTAAACLTWSWLEQRPGGSGGILMASGDMFLTFSENRAGRETQTYTCFHFILRASTRRIRIYSETIVFKTVKSVLMFELITIHEDGIWVCTGEQRVHCVISKRVNS